MCIGVQAAFLTIVMNVASTHTAKPELLPVDGVSLPGGEISIGVRIVDPGRRSLNVNVAGHKVQIVEESAGKEAVSSAPLEASFASDGLALVKWKSPEKAGLLRFHAHAERSIEPLVTSGDASLRIAVVPPESPMLFVAIPQTIQLPSDGDALRALSSSRTIVYLALRKLDNPVRLRYWLEASKLPDGPILTPRSGLVGASLDALLASLQLSAWRARPCAVIPIDFDTTPFARNGIRTIQLGGALTAKAAEVMVSGAPDWNEARKIVEASR